MKLVDSDILIAHLRGVTAARDWLEAARRETGPLAISAISIPEGRRRHAIGRATRS